MKFKYTGEKDINEVLARYSAITDCGKDGKRADVAVRYAVTGKIERCHSAGDVDCVVKRGVTVEIKTGCGELEPFGYDTKEEAIEAMEAGRFLLGCTHVAYLPRFTGDNVDSVLVLPRKRFISLLQKYNLIRVKQATCGTWKVTIQSYLPTPTFHASKDRAVMFLEDLETYGLYLDCFCEKMLNRELYEVEGL